MWLNWLPWRYIVRRVARARGFVDPISVLSHLHRFAQPSEVAAPMELLRAGVVFHARGLMNTGAIQHNLDWIWPYWVERQFDPHDDAFIPRAFSITHVNLTHRNWTAVGIPDFDALPLVDPRGLLTPHWDAWSLDTWIVTDDGRQLVPSQLAQVEQRLDIAGADGLAVVTQSNNAGLSLRARVDVTSDVDGVVCNQRLTAEADSGGWLVVALRPYNPEGVTFLHDIALADNNRGWTIEGTDRVQFDRPVERHRVSTYRAGDVWTALKSEQHDRSARCDVGMVTAAAMFRLTPHESRQITVQVPLHLDPEQSKANGASRSPFHTTWPEALREHCRLSVPDEKFQFLYDAALRTVVLHCPGDVYPGPYTYKRFWYRDAAFILHAMLCVGLTQRSKRALDRFPLRQTNSGYFRSQEGEWDSNGQAIWIMRRYCELTGRETPAAWQGPIRRGAEWIVRKRLSDHIDAPHAGLLPSGFSAEHLGPNDYYYWDDFWSAGGMLAAAQFAREWGDADLANRYRDEAGRLMHAIDRSLVAAAPRQTRAGVPASPYRRMDAGAIGSITVGYPLQLWDARDQRLLDTVDFLVKQCFFKGGFFQDMIHSGINPYLTLHVAQVQLRAGDPAFFERMQTIAELASPTGQWPEAIHPRTLGGCMGDGQHVWAAAEWLLMMRNCFVREEGDRLILASGIPAAWLDSPQKLTFGPAPTPYGEISISIEPRGDQVEIAWEARWRREPPPLEIRPPGCEPMTVPAASGRISIARTSGAKT